MKQAASFDLDLALQQALSRAAWQVSAVGLTLQYARERIQASELQALLRGDYCDSTLDWRALRQAMFAGVAINRSEQRAVGHAALRAPASATFCPGGQANVMTEVEDERQRQRAFAERVRADADIHALLHIGIGGSDLGPRLQCAALPDPLAGYNVAGAPSTTGSSTSSGATFDHSPVPYFVANVDAHEMHRVLQTLDPRHTLVLVASKTFTTQETLANASIARSWLRSAGVDATHRLVALTANPQAAVSWGVPQELVFRFWDWVGGRYSLWSSVGLVTRIARGNAAFDAMLEGARAMDEHFQSAELEHNLPALAAHLDYWNRVVLGLPTRMLAAYDARLGLLVPYLQQLSMESLGKQVNPDGLPITNPSSPVLWGDVGTNAQHAFFQQLHQGDQRVACELVGVRRADHPYAESHTALHANLLAQAEVLTRGYHPPASLDANARPASERTCRGQHPVSVLWLEQLDAFHLGALIAYWEHRTFVFGCLLGVNPFDQWGVERGKQVARQLLPALRGEASAADLTPETAAAVAFLRGA